MANRLAGSNVIVVDSAMGNLGVFMGTGNFTTFMIQGFAFSFANTAGRCIFSGANTTDVLADFLITAHVGSGGLVANPCVVTFPRTVTVDLKVPTLSNGTGWVYLA